MLQLHLDFDMGALEALLTPEVVEEVVAKLEKEVVATQEAAPEVVNANRGVRAEIRALTGALKVIEVEDVDKS